MQSAFADAFPFRHVVIDNFYNEQDALELHQSFPKFSQTESLKAQYLSGRVYGPPPESAAPAIRYAFQELASRNFAKSISCLTGIEPLAMDSTLNGAGVHIGLRGSALAIHADHNTHPKASWLYRRLNLLIYLNPNWNPTWGANLLIYDNAGINCVAEIEPRFNRAIIMEVHDQAYHGYRPLKIPKAEMRQMLAAYFYAPQPSRKQNVLPHDTIFSRTKDDTYLNRLNLKVRRAVIHRLNRLMPKADWDK